jgi:hypothetical protein
MIFRAPLSSVVKELVLSSWPTWNEENLLRSFARARRLHTFTLYKLTARRENQVVCMRRTKHFTSQRFRLAFAQLTRGQKPEPVLQLGDSHALNYCFEMAETSLVIEQHQKNTEEDLLNAILDRTLPSERLSIRIHTKIPLFAFGDVLLKVSKQFGQLLVAIMLEDGDCGSSSF